MKLEIMKSFRFEAAHSLPNLPAEHKCHRLHGHSYEVVVGVRGEVEPVTGWVLDYAEISGRVEPLIAKLDHQNLNEVMGTAQTTAERLAIWFAERLSTNLPGFSRIEVRETPRTNVILTIGEP